ncbi:MAG: hypothetical protein ABIH83_05040 [Candidatus Micrarchaeota archaeon]
MSNGHKYKRREKPPQEDIGEAPDPEYWGSGKAYSTAPMGEIMVSANPFELDFSK